MRLKYSNILAGGNSLINFPIVQQRTSSSSRFMLINTHHDRKEEQPSQEESQSMIVTITHLHTYTLTHLHTHTYTLVWILFNDIILPLSLSPFLFSNLNYRFHKPMLRVGCVGNVQSRRENHPHRRRSAKHIQTNATWNYAGISLQPPWFRVRRCQH